MKKYTKLFPISDILHLLKAMRRKYMNNTISVRCKSPLIKMENEKTVLQQSNTYKSITEKNSSLFSMRDDLENNEILNLLRFHLIECLFKLHIDHILNTS